MADLPDDFSILTMPNRSDDSLLDARVVCAGGRAQKVLANVSEEGFKTPPADRFCAAVLKETIKRGQDSDLYTFMQPGSAWDELRAVLSAAGQNASHYINVEGVEKTLSCPLAFDAGYVYGDGNPDAPIATATPDAKIAEIARDCFDNGTKTPSLNGMIAGARMAQGVKNGMEISDATVGDKQPNIADGATGSISRGAALGQ